MDGVRGVLFSLAAEWSAVGPFDAAPWVVDGLAAGRVLVRAMGALDPNRGGIWIVVLVIRPAWRRESCVAPSGLASS